MQDFLPLLIHSVLWVPHYWNQCKYSGLVSVEVHDHLYHANDFSPVPSNLLTSGTVPSLLLLVSAVNITCCGLINRALP